MTDYRTTNPAHHRRIDMFSWVVLGLLQLGFFSWTGSALAQKQKLDRVPELTKPDYSQVEYIDDVFDLPETWSYQPDSPASPESQHQRDIKIQLPTYAKSLAFSALDTNIAAVLEDMSMSDGRGNSTELWQIRRIKLSTGQMSAPTKLYQAANRKDGEFIPSGFTMMSGGLVSIGIKGDIALLKTNRKGRLDMWTIKGRSKHIAGWLPYADEERAGQRVFDAIAHSPETAVTLNFDGRLIGWKLPECRAVYERALGTVASTNSFQSLGIFLLPGYSPNLKHMAVWSGSNLLLIDLATGKSLASINAPKGPGFLRPSFSPDGSMLAFSEAENFVQILVIVDLKTGITKLRIPLPSDIWKNPTSSDVNYGGFTWVNENHGVVGNLLLIDLATGRPVFKFNSPTLNSRNHPPMFNRPGYGYTYFSPKRPYSLNVVTLPHEQARSRANDTPDVFAAGPGSTISVEVDTSAAPRSLQTKLRNAVMGRIKANRMEVGDSERVNLTMQVEVVDTGREVKVETRRSGALGSFRGTGKGEMVKVQAVVFAVTVTVDGEEVWRKTNDFLPRDNETWVPDPIRTTEQELLDLQWKRVEKSAALWLDSNIPKYVLDPKSKADFPSGPLPEPNN